MKEKSLHDEGGPLRSLKLSRDSGMYSCGMREARSDVEEEEDVAIALEEALFCFELELEEDDC